MAPKRTVLICGDSVLDNGAYVGLFGRSLKSHLGRLLQDWTIDFRALDGAVCSDVTATQLRRGSGEFDAVVVSAGGNDALGHIHLFEDATERRFINFALTIADLQEAFRSDYAAVLDAAGRHAEEVLALTSYRPRFHLDGLPEDMRRACGALLSIFNDVIQEETGVRGHHVLELRRICVTDAHFADPIEPSDFGGRSIALAIRGWLEGLGRQGKIG